MKIKSVHILDIGHSCVVLIRLIDLLRIECGLLVRRDITVVFCGIP